VGYVGRCLKAWVAALKDRRESARMSLHLVAYYWNGASPQAYEVKEVSPIGAYIVTPDRWYMGTVLRLTLQYGGSSNGNGAEAMGAPAGLAHNPEMTRMVRAKLVRVGPDGIGVRLIHLSGRERRSFQKFLTAVQAREHSFGEHNAPGGEVQGVE
jgi:hypothetical protein